MSEDSAVAGLGQAKGQPNGHSHSPVSSSPTNGHSHLTSSSPPSHPIHPSPSLPISAPTGSGPLFVVRSLLSLLRLRCVALWPLSSPSSALLASLAFLCVTLDAHRRPFQLRTMLTFGPSALVNELAHLFLPLVSLPAFYMLYRQLQAHSAQGQWKLWAAVASHTVSAVSLLSLIAKSLASRASFRYALLHPGQLTPAAKRALTFEQDVPTNAIVPAPHSPALPAVLTSLSPVTPPSPPAAQPPSPSNPAPAAASTAVPAQATHVWSADELSAIDRVGDLNVWRCVQAMVPVPVLSRWKDGIRVDTGVTYHVIHGLKKQQHLKLDVYHPPNSPLSHNSTAPAASADPLFPLVVYVHGGGWVTGDKRWGSLPLLVELAHAGHVVVTINYRLAPYARFPSFLVDIKRAIAYAKRHAASAWHADASRTFLAGESAGGHLATLAALTQSNPVYQPGFEDVDTSCVAVIDLYGVHSFVKGKQSERVKQEESFFDFLHSYVLTHPISSHPSLYHAASPLSVLTALLSSTAPPSTATPLPYFFCAHGTTDSLVPIEDTWRFFAAIAEQRQRQAAGLGEGGLLDVCVDVTGGSHAFNIVYNARTYALNDALGIWMRRVVRAVDEREERDEQDRHKQAKEVARWKEIVRTELDKPDKLGEGGRDVLAPRLHSKL